MKTVYAVIIVLLTIVAVAWILSTPQTATILATGFGGINGVIKQLLTKPNAGGGASNG